MESFNSHFVAAVVVVGLGFICHAVGDQKCGIDEYFERSKFDLILSRLELAYTVKHISYVLHALLVYRLDVRTLTLYYH